jgi:hypothetical protein
MFALIASYQLESFHVVSPSFQQKKPSEGRIPLARLQVVN